MTRLGKLFGDLKVRPKLMVLHNLFFLVLASAVYFSLIPLVREYVAEEALIRELKWALFLVLGAVYVLAVVLLELVVMPLYVYHPLRLMLEADKATQQGDRGSELVDETFIPGDEIGQIMRSRNATVADLRRQEDDLAEALSQLEETAADLARKNRMLETAERNLADQDRLVSLGLLSASVAHELNTPLSVLRGSIEKLLETVPDETSQDRLWRMMRAARRLQDISESLLDFARVRQPVTDTVSLRQIVEESWTLLGMDKRSAGVRFANELRDDDLVTGNPDRLVQVFVNLLRNSLAAIQAKGSIIVRSERIANAGQEWISVSVQDDGVGIPPDVLPNIFEAFVTSRLDSHGTGLGLTVAEGIVYQHGGAIEAANRPSGGARLEVRLPAARSEVMA